MTLFFDLPSNKIKNFQVYNDFFLISIELGK